MQNTRLIDPSTKVRPPYNFYFILRETDQHNYKKLRTPLIIYLIDKTRYILSRLKLNYAIFTIFQAYICTRDADNYVQYSIDEKRHSSKDKKNSDGFGNCIEPT